MTALIVSTLDGSCVLTDDDAASETVGDVKLALQDRRGVHRFQMRLVLGDRILEDGLDLAALGTPKLRLNLITLPYREDDASKQALEGALRLRHLEPTARACPVAREHMPAGEAPGQARRQSLWPVR